jgi:hypothetical protein
MHEQLGLDVFRARRLYFLMFCTRVHTSFLVKKSSIFFYILLSNASLYGYISGNGRDRRALCQGREGECSSLRHGCAGADQVLIPRRPQRPFFRNFSTFV